MIHIKMSRKIFASMLLVVFSSDVILDDLAVFLLFFCMCDSFLFLLFSFCLSFFFLQWAYIIFMVPKNNRYILEEENTELLKVNETRLTNFEPSCLRTLWVIHSQKALKDNSPLKKYMVNKGLKKVLKPYE